MTSFADNQQHHVITADKPGKRLDIWLSEHFPSQSRSNIQRLIKENHVLLQKKACTAKSPVQIGDQIEIHFPPAKSLDLKPIDIPLDILFEDAELIVINKPIGMVVHPGAGNYDETLVHALLHHCKGQLSGIGGVERPGIVHRLDKDTSGCVVVAKSDQAHQGLSTAFHDHLVQKIYLAVVWGKPRMLSGVVDAPIGRNPGHRTKMAVTHDGREAVTRWKLVKSGEKISLLECKIETGRTHQIRVHLSEIKHPIVGDSTYGKPKDPEISKLATRQLLHAWKLSFDHPITGKRIECTAPVPADMQKVIDVIQ